jgi:signal transduction histidine kinase/ActR/RegA family two-component response regulator
LNAFHFHGDQASSPQHPDPTSTPTCFQVFFLLYIQVFTALPLRMLLCAVLSLPALSLDGRWNPGLGRPLAVEIAHAADGLDEYCWNVAWDADGIAYLGRERLWRWDGTRLTPLGPDIFRQLRAMDFDASGKLWLGGVNQFGVLDPGTGEYQSRLDWIPPAQRNFGPSWIIHCEPGRVWMGTANRLFRFEAGEATVWEFAGQHRVIFHFLDSGIYAHEADRGLWKIQDDQLVLINDQPDFLMYSVLKLEDDDFGNLKALSGIGFFELSKETYGISKKNEFYPKGRLVISAVERICSDLILAGTLGEGVFLIKNDGTLFPVLFDEFIDESTLILNLKVDKSGQVWVLSNKGVFLFMLQIPAGITAQASGFPQGKIRNILLTENHLGVSHDTGYFILTKGDQKSPSLTPISNGISRNSFYFNSTLIFDRYDSLYRVEGNEVEQLHVFGGEILGFAVTEEGLLAVSFHDRVEVYRVDGEWRLERLGELPVGGGLEWLEADGSGRLWGAAPLAPLLEIGLDEDGGWWYAWHAAVAGAQLEGEEHAVAMTGAGPVLVLEESVVRRDGPGGAWIRAERRGGHGRVDALAFRRLEGLTEGWMVIWDEHGGAYRMEELSWADGQVPRWRQLPWVDLRRLGKVHKLALTDDPERFFIIGGMRGVMLAARDLAARIPAPAKPVIFDNRGLLKAGEGLTAAFGEDVLRFHYSTPTGGLYYPVRYSSRLKGREAGWSEPSALPLRELGQVWEGSYELEVKAVDPFGRESPAAVVGLRILPPWYRTHVAYLAAATCLLAMGYGILRLRERRLRARQTALEALVRTRTHELERANAFKDEFIANLSHEIRNPLNGVIGFIRQLKDGVAPPARSLEALRGAAHYLQATVEEVLDFSKLQSGRLEVEHGLFDIGEMVTGVAVIYREQAVNKGIDFSWRLSVPEGLGVVSDARKVQQIIGNLTGNAVKFTAHGSVHLGVRLQRENAESGTLRIWVTDTGRGIAEGERERIFEKFYQVRKDGAKASGTGLGLALVKRFAERLGGGVEVESEPGNGSTFVVNLPVGVRALEPGLAKARRVARKFDGLPVLIVEDGEYNRMVLTGLLVEMGCRVDCATDGISGLEKARSGRYRAIFLDWDLPGMNGLEIARELVAGGTLAPGTRIFGLTAHATTEVRRKCLEGGMDAFMTKPVQPEKVEALLLDCVPVQRFVTGKGLLAEMPGDWPAILERWKGYFADYAGELEAAVAAAEPEPVRKAAHRLLGHLRMLELETLPEAVCGLMLAAQAGDRGGIDREWRRLQELLAAFRAELDGVTLS